jgi:hypothetical protein
MRAVALCASREPTSREMSPRAEQIFKVRRSREPACRANSAYRKPGVLCAARPHQRFLPRGLWRKEAAAYATLARSTTRIT